MTSNPGAARPKLLTVIGARPQFVKAAVVSHAIAKDARLEEVLVHTGQHYDDNMSGIFFEELQIPAAQFNLGIGSGSHARQTGEIMIALEEVCINAQPDMMLVYGDTNSTLAAALVSAKLHIPLAHVEAGLRSFNRTMPEEINRMVTDRVSDVLFAPTDTAVANLLQEGFARDSIVRTGDVMFDAALKFTEIAKTRSTILKQLDLQGKSYALATVHRASNVDDEAALRNIAGALAALSQKMPVVLPLHPRTRGRWTFETPKNLTIIDPVGIFDMYRLESAAQLIVTDSGGVQKEAFFHRVPCVTLRTDTEWMELVEGGFNRLAPPTAITSILEACEAALASKPDFSAAGHLYGDGDAAGFVARYLADWISGLKEK